MISARRLSASRVVGVVVVRRPEQHTKENAPSRTNKLAATYNLIEFVEQQHKKRWRCLIVDGRVMHAH